MKSINEQLGIPVYKGDLGRYTVQPRLFNSGVTSDGANLDPDYNGGFMQTTAFRNVSGEDQACAQNCLQTYRNQPQNLRNCLTMEPKFLRAAEV